MSKEPKKSEGVMEYQAYHLENITFQVKGK